MRAGFLVMAGGAAGASVRWSVGELLPLEPGQFPWATFAVNVVGCLLIGLTARRFARGTDAWLVLAVGGLGGLTTFSAFAVETRLLVAADRPMTALVYVAATMIVGLGATELTQAGGSST